MPHLPKDEILKAQGPLKYTKCASLNPHINVWCNKYQGAFKKKSTGSFDVGDAPALVMLNHLDRLRLYA